MRQVVSRHGSRKRPGFSGNGRQIAAALMAMLGAATIASAASTIVDEQSTPDGSWRVTVDFAAEAPRTLGPRSESVPLFDPISGETTDVALEDNGLSLTAETVLVAPPAGISDDPTDWTLVADIVSFADGSSTAGADASAAVVLASVRVGAFHAIQMTIDPTLALDGSGAKRAAQRLEIRLTAGAASTASRSAAGVSRIVIDDAAKDTAAAVFANPETALAQLEQSASGRGRLAAGPVRSAIPAPAGSHRVTYNEGNQLLRIPLGSVGASVGTADQVGIVHHGSTVSRGGILGSDLWFFAPRRHTLSDTNDSVFTSVGEAPSPEMATRGAYDTLSASVTPAEVSIPRTRRWDMNQRMYPRLNAAGTATALPIYERSVDRVVGDRFPYHRARNPAAGGSLSSYTYQLPVLDVVTTNTLTMVAGYNGVNSNNALNPDHFANLTLAGLALPTATWDNIALYYEHTYNIAFGAIPAPGNWSLTHTIPASAASASLGDWQNLLFVELSWQGKPRVIGGRRGDIELASDAAPRLVTIGGFPAGTTVGQIYLLDITDPTAPTRLTGPTLFADETGGVAIEFEAPASPCHFYVERVVSTSDIALPNTTVVAETLPPVLAGGTALRAIYVRQASLAAALQPLVLQRGPGILELEPQAAYNVFNGGQQSPESLRDALSTLIDEAPLKVAIPTVLLVGHGSLDRRNLLGLQTYPQVTFFVDESVRSSGFTIENSVDFPYSLLFGADNFPDIRLGRWPVRDAADITMATTRNLAHDAATATLAATTRPALFIADDQAVGDPPFDVDQPSLVALWASNGRPNRKMIVDFAAPDLGGLMNTSAVKVALEEKGAGNVDQGVSYAFYVGHGQFNTWAGETIATSDVPAAASHIGQFNTVNQWPVAATFTCLNGYYAFPGQTARSMSEAWLFHNNRGAVANIAPVSVDFYGEQKLLQDEVAGQLGTANASLRPRTLGEAWFSAQTAYITKYPSLFKTLREYILFGDPDSLSMVVNYTADLKMTITPSAAVVAPGDNVTYDVTVTNMGAWEARDVEIAVTLPTGLGYLASTQSWGNSAPVGQTVLFNLGTLRAGEAATGQVFANVDIGAPVSLTTTSVASCDFPDSAPGDNTAQSLIATQLSDAIAVY